MTRCDVFMLGLGSWGDVLPLIGVGTELASGGLAVRIGCNEHFAGAVTAAGLQHEQLGDEETYRTVTADARLWHPTKGLRLLLGYCARAVEPTHEATLRAIDDGAGAVICHQLGWGAKIAGEERRVPVATVALAPASILSRESPPVLGTGLDVSGWPRWLRGALLGFAERLLDLGVAGPVNRFRRDRGLPPISRVLARWVIATDPFLCLWPDWFGPVPSDAPPGAMATGFIHNDGPEETLAPEVRDFLLAGEGHAVVATFGSGNQHAARLLEATARAADALGRRSLLLTRFPGEIGALPGSALVAHHAPLAAVLEHAGCLVHHGGIGTTARALRAGVPQVVTALAYDQHDNALRLRRLGVGERLKGAKADTPSIRGAIERAIGRAETAAEVASREDGLGPARAADRIRAMLAR